MKEHTVLWFYQMEELEKLLVDLDDAVVTAAARWGSCDARNNVKVIQNKIRNLEKQMEM